MKKLTLLFLLLASGMAFGQGEQNNFTFLGPSLNQAQVSGYGYDIRGFGGDPFSDTGVTGVGADNGPALQKCAQPLQKCHIPAVYPNGTTHIRIATQANLGTADGGRMVECDGSNTDNFNSGAVGMVSIDVDMGGQTGGPAILIGSPNTVLFNGIYFKNCMFTDISASHNSPGAFLAINTSNIVFDHGGTSAFVNPPAAVPSNPGTFASCSTNATAQPGTADFTNSNATITGHGTSFVAGLVNATIVCTSGACNGSTGKILSVNTTNQTLTLTAGFGGTTQAGATFSLGIDNTAGLTLFEQLQWVGGGYLSGKPSTEGSGQTLASLGCASGQTHCSCTPLTPASVPAGVAGVEVLWGTATGGEVMQGAPFPCTPGGSCDFTHNLNLGGTNTAATAIYSLNTSSSASPPNKFDHTGAYGWGTTGSVAQGFGVHGDSGLANSYSNQPHFIGTDHSGDNVALDFDYGTAQAMVSDCHIFEGPPATGTATAGIQTESGGLTVDNCHIEGPALASPTAGPEINVTGSGIILSAIDLEHNDTNGSKSTVGVNGVALQNANISINCANLTKCFQDDGTSARNLLHIGGPGGSFNGGAAASNTFQATDNFVTPDQNSFSSLRPIVTSSTFSATFGPLSLVAAGVVEPGVNYWRIGAELFQIAAGATCGASTEVTLNITYTDSGSSGSTQVPIANWILTGASQGAANTPVAPAMTGAAPAQVGGSNTFYLRNKASTAISYGASVSSGGCGTPPTFQLILFPEAWGFGH